MYNELRDLLSKGYEVAFRPNRKGDVTLTVQEARNGICKGCEVSLNPFEWQLVEKGIAERLKEAAERLSARKKAAPSTPKKKS
ncbi:MAG TPA: hypothetical protein VGE39_00470 [Prosthecobacter sp.]